MINSILTLSISILILICPALSQERKPAVYGILVDNSLSLMNQVDNATAAAQEVLNRIGSENRISLFAFATDPVTKNALISKGSQCTDDHDLVRNQLKGLFAVSGQTALIDSIKTAAEFLDSKKPSNCGESSERKLVLITDGEDRASRTSPADLIAALKTTGVKVYAIGFVSRLNDDRGFLPKSARQKAREFLELIAKETGGKVVYPKKNQMMADVAKELFGIKSPK